MRAWAALSAVLFLAGCSTNREDQAFFETGWVKPQAAADRRLYGPPTTPDAELVDEPTARPAGRE